MSQRFQGRHGHVRRRSSLPAAEPSSASTAAELRPEPPAPAPVAPPEPPPKPVFEEYQGGARRSVFDLLKEKYPDLGGGVPPAKPLIAPTPPPVAAATLAAQEKAAQEKATQERLAREKAAQEKAAQEKATQERLARERAAQEKAAQEKAAQEKAAQEKAAQEKATQERLAREKAAQEKAAQEKAAQEKLALEEAAQEKATRERLAREKAAQEKAAQEKATQERLALEKAAQEKTDQEKAAQAKAAQEKLAREKATQATLAVVPAAAVVAPEAALTSVPMTDKVADRAETPPLARRARRPTLSSKKVLPFWAGVVLALLAGVVLLSRLKPVPQNVAAAPTPSLPPAVGLSLEPEKVVVTLPPAKLPPATVVPPPKETRPAATPAAANPRDKKAEPKPAPTKPEASRMVIEPVAPVVPPVRIGGSQPEYPVDARAAGVEGTVVLYGLIGRDGKVRDARVVRGLSPPLDAAALAAFRTWRFSPATQKGKKVEFKYNAGIEFRINSPAEQVAATSEPELAPAAPIAAAPEAPLPYGGNFTAPVRTTMVWPQKPLGAQMVKGEVTLQLIVGKGGEVQDIAVLSGLPQGVTEAAIEAVRQWKFRPARQNGEPVTVYHRVSLRF